MLPLGFPCVVVHIVDLMREERGGEGKEGEERGRKEGEERGRKGRGGEGGGGEGKEGEGRRGRERGRKGRGGEERGGERRGRREDGIVVVNVMACVCCFECIRQDY